MPKRRIDADNNLLGLSIDRLCPDLKEFIECLDQFGVAPGERFISGLHH